MLERYTLETPPGGWGTRLSVRPQQAGSGPQFMQTKYIYILISVHIAYIYVICIYIDISS